jgi:hypothetical protein
MEHARIYILLALFYPVSLLLLFTGALAFFLLISGIDPQWVIAPVLSFLSIGLTGIVVVAKAPLKKFGYLQTFIAIALLFWLVNFLYLALFFSYFFYE